MQTKMVGRCPICNNPLKITKLGCDRCGITLEGQFTGCRFCQLSSEQRTFAEVFIKCRGSIKDVEKELGISYPTVRGRLDNLIEALGYKVEHVVDNDEVAKKRRQVLDSLSKGEMTPEEAIQLLKNRE
jgi:hypothetical protein